MLLTSMAALLLLLLQVCIVGLTTMYGLPGSSQMGPLKIQEPYSAGRRVLKGLEQQECHATVLLSHLG
jgi:hypothetical protein